MGSQGKYLVPAVGQPISSNAMPAPTARLRPSSLKIQVLHEAPARPFRVMSHGGANTAFVGEKWKNRTNGFDRHPPIVDG